MSNKKAQVISAVQEKGGAGKSTMLCCMAAQMAVDGANVLLIDTDPQGSCVAWADTQEIENLDYVHHLEEDSLIEKIEGLKARYDVILIDTAGFASQISSYVIVASDLVLIPSGGSKFTVFGAVKTWKHVRTTTMHHKDPPLIRVVFWGVKPMTNVFKHAVKALNTSGIATVNQYVGILAGFESMSWTGGGPEGSAAKAFKSFIGELQIDNLLEFYRVEREGDLRGAA